MKASLVLAFTAVLGASVAQATPTDTEAEFRSRNPQAWTTVTVGAEGFINHVVTTDPDLRIRTLDADGHYQWDDAAVDRVRTLLRVNADLFGIDPADADRVAAANGNLGYWDNATGFLLVAIKLDPAPGLDITVQPRIPMTPTVTGEQVAAQVIGHRYAARTASIRPAQLDCRMGGRGRCTAKTIVQTRRIVVAAEDVEVAQGMIALGGARRLVHCLDLGQTPRSQRARPDQPTLQLRPGDGGPTMPLLVDAVSGKRLAVSESTCNEIWRRYAK